MIQCNICDDGHGEYPAEIRVRKNVTMELMLEIRICRPCRQSYIRQYIQGRPDYSLAHSANRKNDA